MGQRDRVRQAQHLRDMAEQYLRLASSEDPFTRNVLVTYASEFLARAQQIEGTVGVSGCQTPDLSDSRRWPPG
jgi:hypothetical protein